MRYLNAAEAARALGIGDKTIRRWLKAGRFPSAIVRENREYAIPEDEIEALKQHRLKYVHTKTTSHDQSPDITALAEKLAVLEQEVAELRKGQSISPRQEPSMPIQAQTLDAIPQKEVTQNRTTTAKKEGSEKRAYNRKQDTSLPDGCILASKFAVDHGIARPTFIDHMTKGLGPGLIDMSTDTIPQRDQVAHNERPKPRRPREKEKYLTSNQQHEAFKFWQRHHISFAECHDSGCWCHTIKNGEE
jgi:excisionase family DNA binding protein